MERQQFKATEGLLHDVMRKQAGSIEKAILEAVMNSVDAGASEIVINVSEKTVQVNDDGEGMTEEEISEYFRKFGLKGDDVEDKEFGKFRMGRGQIFNFGRNFWYTLDNTLVVDLDNDEAEIDHFEERITLDTSGLSYNLLDIPEEAPEEDGCRISVQLYDPIEYPDDKASEVEELIAYIPWLHDVNIRLNGEKVYHEFEPDHETPDAFFKIGTDNYSTKTSIYNKGAFVKEEHLNQTGGIIVTKTDLDVNLARNDILEGDPIYNRVLEQFQDATFEQVCSRDDKDLKEREKKWLLEQSSKDESKFDKVKEKQILEDVKGQPLAPSDLEGEKVAFGKRGNKQAQDAMEKTGTVVLNRRYEDEATSALENNTRFGKVSLTQVIEDEMRWEMKEWDYEELSKRRRQNFDRAEWFLKQTGFKGEVNPGYSANTDAWKDDDNTVFIDKAFLKKNKQEFILEALPHILEVAAQPGDSREGLSHGFSFKDNFWDLAQDMGEYQRELLNNEAP